jgi:hypothetical protein
MSDFCAGSARRSDWQRSIRRVDPHFARAGGIAEESSAIEHFVAGRDDRYFRYFFAVPTTFLGVALLIFACA